MAILWVSTGPCLNTLTVEFVKVSRVPCIQMNRLIDCLALFTHCEPRFFGNPKGVWMPTFNGCKHSFLWVGFQHIHRFFAPDVLQLLLPCRWVEQNWPHPSSAVSTRCFLKKNPKQKTPEDKFQRCFVEALEAGIFPKKNARVFLVPRCKLMNL